MLKPLKPCELVAPNFVVVDIENRPDGSVITIDVCWRELGKKVHRLFRNWKTFWNWIIAKARNDDRFRILYAHNGGGWDWLSLCHYLLTEGKKKHHALTGILAASKLVTMTVQIKKRLTIHFCDSFQLLRSPLATLAKKFRVTNKIDLTGKLPHEIYESNPDLFFEYVSADTESLLEVLEISLKLLHENVAPIGTFGYTIGSTAMKVFRTMLQREIAVPYDESIKTFLREGYKGGRVEVFQGGYYPNVTVFDVNSLYPYAMLTTPVPVSDRGSWVETFDAELPGCYHINFRQTDRNIPAVLMCNGLGAYEGEGVYFSPEIALLKRVNPGCDLKINRGYVFLDSEKLFQDYVNKLYGLRLTDPDGPVSLLCKFLLNSLYGKFAQNPERTLLIEVPDFDSLYDIIADGAKIVPINDELGVYGMTSNHAAAFEHVGIAGMITSQARVILYDGMLACGVENVLYCDTDSIHSTTSLPPNLVGGKIGQFKKEFCGEGCYVGKKLYALRKSEWCSIGQQWSTKIRAKGITVGGRNGSSIRFDDFIRLSKRGETFKADYSQPATCKQVFSGAQPCSFQPRSRTIRRTDKGTN